MPTVDNNGNILISAEEFKQGFPEFADTLDSDIDMYIEESTCYISNKYTGDISVNCRGLMIKLMTAHLLSLSANNNGGIANGAVAGQVVNATIEQVHVSVALPKNSNPFQYFLNQTSYGQRLLALIQTKITSIYYGGSFQRVFR